MVHTILLRDCHTVTAEKNSAPNLDTLTIIGLLLLGKDNVYIASIKQTMPKTNPLNFVIFKNISANPY